MNCCKSKIICNKKKNKKTKHKDDIEGDTYTTVSNRENRTQWHNDITYYLFL